MYNNFDIHVHATTVPDSVSTVLFHIKAPPEISTSLGPFEAFSYLFVQSTKQVNNFHNKEMPGIYYI
jgi:hypothetical protein